MATLVSTPFSKMQIGDTATFERTLTEKDLVLFATVSGDHNPVHLDKEYAENSAFGERIAHGMWTGALISAALAMHMPGPGGIYRGQELKFMQPAKIGDTLTVKLEVLEKNERTKLAVIQTNVVNQQGKMVAKGKATIIPNQEEISIESAELPAIHVDGLD